VAAKVSVYKQSLDAGNDALGTDPHSGAAIAAFTRAVDASPNRPKRAAALQMLMIAYSMAGDHKVAFSTGEKALEIATKDFDRGRILRDLNLARLRYIVTLKDLIRQSIELGLAIVGLHKSIAYLLKDPAHALEANMSWVALARTLDIAGHRDEADRILRASAPYVFTGGNPIYELNFLIVYVAIMGRSSRKSFYDRIATLIAQTGHTRRNEELLLIKLGGHWLWRFVQSHPQLIQLAGQVAGRLRTP